MYSVRLAEKRDIEAENFMKGVFFLSCPYRHSAYSHFISLNRPSAVPYGSRWRADEARTGISVRLLFWVLFFRSLEPALYR